jgi:hypothetical protein
MSRVRLESAETYTAWVSRLREDSSRRRTLASRTNASGSSSSRWPTAVVQDSKNGRNSGSGRQSGSSHHDGDTLTDAISNWSTPTASDTKGPDQIGRRSPGDDRLATQVARIWATPDAEAMNDREEPETFLARQAEAKAKGYNGNGFGTPLAMQAKMFWPTPRTVTGGPETAERKQELGRLESGGGDLQAAAVNWPTPAARDYKGANSAEHMEVSSGAMHLDQLPNFVAHLWQTPSVASATGGQANRGGDRQEEVLLAGQAREVSIHLPQTISTDGDTSSKVARTLNPLFVEWLMTWPEDWTLMALGLRSPPPRGWTGSESLETGLCQWKAHWRGVLKSIVLHDAPPAQPSLFG